MKAGMPRITTKARPGLQNLIFPGCVMLIYGILFVFNSTKAVKALTSSVNILLTLIIPLSMVFTLMFLLNLFLRPAHVARFLGRRSGARGLALSAVAGIISMGPIYAWYPLLKELKKKGAVNSLIAVFLGSRAVKPFLLPIMISYFGWLYVVLLTLFTITGSLTAGYLVGILVED